MTRRARALVVCMPLLLWLTACDGRPELDRAADATQTALLSRPATTPTEAGGDGPFAVAEAAILQGALPAAGPRTEITVLNPLTGQQIDIETAPGQTTYSLSLPSGLWVLSARDGDRQLPIRCPTNSENCDGLHVVLNVVAGQMVRGVDISAAPPSTAAAPGAEGALEPATIAGSIVYPPSLSADAAASFRASVFALDTTSGRNTELVLAPGQDTYSLSVSPGIWQVYSYLLNTQGEFRHAEIKCARAVVCAGGSLAQLSLEPGQTVVNVDVIYAREDVHTPGAIFPRERGEFKFGGQAHSFAQPAADQMRAAGMDWVKFQVHVGDSDGVQKVERGHARGFRVLISLLGDRERVLDPAYSDEYAQYAALLAAEGADAIEIWNEPNLAREWPRGHINPNAYVELLAAAHGGIKGANPDTLVISAGLAATLISDALRSGELWTEVDYSSQFVAAGGLSYLDCVGVHYNLGVTPPATDGVGLTHDAAFRYFPRLLEYYAQLTRGLRPLCITELGYLTGEGLADLATVAPGFAWAANTTLAQQAAWLSDAVRIASVSEVVEMLIVWNVDFQVYGADPHAGYAIIRPDGSCPACAALGAVFKSQ